MSLSFSFSPFFLPYSRCATSRGFHRADAPPTSPLAIRAELSHLFALKFLIHRSELQAFTPSNAWEISLVLNPGMSMLDALRDIAGTGTAGAGGASLPEFTVSDDAA